LGITTLSGMRMTLTKSLYNTKDIADVRQALTLEQKGLDLLTSLPIAPKQHCLDHCHKTMRVRGVLDRQVNSTLGVMENAFKRYIGYWYPHDLQTFLRHSADYLDLEEDKRWYHSAWQKKIVTLFNKLPTKQQDTVLQYFHQPKGSNSVERKESFKKIIADKSLGFDTIRNVILQVKE
jgi:hypothetical protein